MYRLKIAILFLCFSTLYYAQESNLIAYYPFNGNAYDESGNDNNGIVNGAELIQDRLGNVNGAYYFDGVDDYIQVQDNVINSLAEFTLSSWINYNKKAVSIIGTHDNYRETMLYINPEGEPRIQLWDGTSEWRTDPSPNYILTKNEWHHVVGTWDGEILKLFVDSELICTSNTQQNINIVATSDLLIGDNGRGAFFNGIIDDLRIFDYALSQAEISALYQEENPLTNSITVNLYDSQGNGLTGGIVHYYDSGWIFAGTTADGVLKFNYDGSRETLSLKLEWAGKSYQLSNQDISEPIIFQTINVICSLKDSQNNGLQGGEVFYYAGGWREFGVTNINGITESVELLPGNYSFKVVYAGKAEQKSNINIAQFNPVQFHTIAMAVKLFDSQGFGLENGNVKYYASGWKNFGITDSNGATEMVELLPGSYSFQMLYEGKVEQKSNINILLVNPLTFQTGAPPENPQPIVVKLLDSNGNGIEGGAVEYYASGWREFGTTGVGGITPGRELLPGTYSFRMTYAGKVEQKSNINISEIYPIEFTTQKVTVSLKDSGDEPIEGGIAKYYASGWRELGITDSNGSTLGIELLPGTYAFKMNYAGKAEQKSNIDISLINPVKFITLGVRVRLEDESNLGIPGGVVTYYASGWMNFGTTDSSGETPVIELLPGMYSFKMTYANYTLQESNVNVSIVNPIIFTSSNGILEKSVFSGITDNVHEYRLLDNYPNPFNPSTSITYSVPEEQIVELKIYNVQGKEVVQLVNDRQSAGIYKVRWDASGVSSGIYFYTISAGEFRQTRKMLLLR